MPLSTEVSVRRAAFYLFYDPQGQVDDFVLHTLGQLRAHVEHIFVVSNSDLDRRARARLEGVADTVLVRENVGFDVWAYKEALEAFGRDRLADYDELLLLNCTFFGPIDTFDDLFERMDARPDLDFWGISEHGAVSPHPFVTMSGHLKKVGTAPQTKPDEASERPVVPPLTVDRMDRHLQTHWIGVRSRLFRSADWNAYWDTMAMITSYVASVVLHEARFTPHFDSLGYTHAATFPLDDYDSDHPIMDDISRLLLDGCPIVKRRTFFHDPLYNESRAIDARRLVDLMHARGYPVEMLYANLARTAQPRALVTNLALLEVLPETDLGYDATAPLKVAAVAHIFYPEMTDEILDRFDHLPGGYDLIVTTADEERRAAIEAVLARRGATGDVRVVDSNRGRDISAFFIACRDVIDGDDYDLVVKLHSKLSPQDAPNIGDMFKRHLFENLLASPGYVANVLSLFQQHSSLGMVIPPVYHIAYPTLGAAWFQNREPAAELAERLAITVPFDTSTPVAAYGSMFIARPQTLRLLAAADFAYDDFPDNSGYSDGALTHVVERLMAYSVLSSGFHVREVMTPHLAAVNYSVLEYRGVVTGELVGPRAREQVKRIKKLKQYRKLARMHDLKVTGNEFIVGNFGPKAAAEAAARPASRSPQELLRGAYRRARRAARRTTSGGRG